MELIREALEVGESTGPSVSVTTGVWKVLTDYHGAKYADPVIMNKMLKPMREIEDLWQQLKSIADEEIPEPSCDNCMFHGGCQSEGRRPLPKTHEGGKK